MKKISYGMFSTMLFIVCSTQVILEPIERRLRAKVNSYKKIQNYF